MIVGFAVCTDALKPASLLSLTLQDGSINIRAALVRTFKVDFNGQLSGFSEKKYKSMGVERHLN